MQTNIRAVCVSGIVLDVTRIAQWKIQIRITSGAAGSSSKTPTGNGIRQRQRPTRWIPVGLSATTHRCPAAEAYIRYDPTYAYIYFGAERTRVESYIPDLGSAQGCAAKTAELAGSSRMR